MSSINDGFDSDSSSMYISKPRNPYKSKVCHFYSDDGHHRLKMVVNAKSYPNISSLKSALTRRIEALPFGVRRIYTPRCRTEIKSLENLKNDGQYVCTSLLKPQRQNLNVISRENNVWYPWKRKTNDQKELNSLLAADGAIGLPQKILKQAWSSAEEKNVKRQIFVKFPGSDEARISLWLNKRSTLNAVLKDISVKLKVPVNKLLTTEGKEVSSLADLFYGSQSFIVQQEDDGYLSNSSIQKPAGHDVPSKKPTNKNKVDVKNLSRTKKNIFSDQCSFKVIVKTNALPSAGTFGTIYITIYGEGGSSSRILLGSGNAHVFQCDSIDEFNVSCENLGNLFKIRLEHEGSEGSGGWFCDEVRIINKENEEFFFPCGRWLSLHDDDWQIYRELPRVNNGIAILPIVTYKISVKTGNVWNCGTAGKVFITMYGDRYGDSGKRHLFNPLAGNTFSMNQVDVFLLEIVWLGEITRVFISHEDDRGQGSSGWFLDGVIIKCKAPQQMKWTFPCYRWLSVIEDDGKMERELKQADTETDLFFQSIMFESQLWKFQNGNEIELMNSSTTPSISSGVFIIHEKEGNLKSFQLPNSELFLSCKEKTVTCENYSEETCNFLVLPESDHSFLIRADGNSQSLSHSYLSVAKSGFFELSKKISDRSKFFVHCKGSYKNNAVISFNTSIIQSMSVNSDMSLTGLGKQDDKSHFIVHRISKGIFCFEALSYKNQFLSMNSSLSCDILGSEKEPNSHFFLHKLKHLGCIQLESVAYPGVFIGVSSHGSIRGMRSSDSQSVRFYPRVVEHGESSKLPEVIFTPPPLQKRHLIPEVEQDAPIRSIPTFLPSIIFSSSRYHEMTFDIVDDASQADKNSSRSKKDDNLSNKEDEIKNTLLDQRIDLATLPDNYSDEEWKVVVSTEESLEDADVILNLFGSEGSCGPVILGGSQLLKQLFVAGNIDEFKIRIPKSIGTIHKLRVELISRTSIMHGSWKVATIKLQNMANNEILKFKFRRWLSRLKDDGDVVRELPVFRPHGSQIPVVKYNLKVVTGIVEGAGTQANVFVNIFGDKGDLGTRLLHRSDKSIKFQKGQADTFILEGVYLGVLKCCIIWHDSINSGEGWFCDEILVTFEDPDAPGVFNTFVFPCRNWLDTSYGDQKIKRVLKPLKTGKTLKSEKLTKTKTKKKTSKIPVYVSSKKILKTSSESQAKHIVSHPVEQTDNYPVFGLPDKLVVRTGRLNKPRMKTPSPGGPGTWELKVTTGFYNNESISLSSADKYHNDDGTNSVMPYIKRNNKYNEPPQPVNGDGVLVVVVYGDEGKSRIINLTTVEGGSMPDVFKPFDKINFKFGMKGIIGNVYKILLGFDEKSLQEQNWLLQEIFLKDPDKEMSYNFVANNKRLIKDEEHDGWMEIPVLINGQVLFPITLYYIEIYTGSIFGAGLKDGQVYVMMIGGRGDTGKRMMLKSVEEFECQHRRNKRFSRGQVNTFELEVVDLDEIERIVVGHNNEDEPGWYLERIVVRKYFENKETIWSFQCARWLDSNKDDGAVHRELSPFTDEDLWIVIITNGLPVDADNENYAISPGNVRLNLTICGDSGDSPLILLKTLPHLNLNDKPNGSNEFMVHLDESFGEIFKIRLEICCHTCIVCHWFIEKVELRQTRSNKRYFFDVDEKLVKQEHSDGIREFPMKSFILESNEPVFYELLPVYTYEVEMFSGGDSVKMPDNVDIIIQVLGLGGNSGMRKLVQKTNDIVLNGKAGMFVIPHVVDLADLVEIQLFFENYEESFDWFLEKIIVKRIGHNGIKHDTYLAFCECRMKVFDRIEAEWSFKLKKIVAEVESVEILKEFSIEEVIEDEKFEEEKKCSLTEWTLNLLLTPESADGSHDNEEDHYHHHIISQLFAICVIYYRSRRTIYKKLGSFQLLESTSWPHGRIASFKLDFDKLSEKFYKIRIGRKEELDPGMKYLHINKIILKHQSSGFHFEFLSPGYDDPTRMVSMKNSWVELPAKEMENPFTSNECSLIEETLSPVPSVLEYSIEIQSGAENNFNDEHHSLFFINISGDLGDTGMRLLKHNNSQDISIMRFTVRAVDLSKIQCIIIGHSDLDDVSKTGYESDHEFKSSSYWFVKRVIITIIHPGLDGDEGDPGSFKDAVVFPCNSWIERSGDGKFLRLLYPHYETKQMVNPPVLPDVNSMDETVPSKEENIEDQPHLKSPASWKVLLRTGKSYDSDEEEEGEDGNKSNNNNIIYIDEFSRKMASYRNHYKYKSYPKPLKGNLVLVVYGEEGDTGVVKMTMLSEIPEEFEPDQELQFEVDLIRNVGQLYKVRIGFDDSCKEDENWMIGAVTLEEKSTGNIYRFEVEDRLIRDDHFDGWLEAALSEFEADDLKKDSMLTRIPLILYTIHIYTSHVDEVTSVSIQAGINLVGKRGDTGMRKLTNHQNYNQPLFRTGQVDSFEVEAVDLKDIVEIVVCFKCPSGDCTWIVNKIVITWEDTESNKEVEFLLNKLFKSHDYVAEYKFELNYYKPDTWKIYILNQISPNEPTDPMFIYIDKLVVVFYGDRGWTKEFELSAVGPQYEKLSWIVKEFMFQENFYSSIGALYKVRIGIPEEIVSPASCYVGNIILRNENQGISHIFEMNSLLQKNELNDGWREVIMFPLYDEHSGVNETSFIEQHYVDKLPMFSYGVQVQTGSEANSGTDDIIFIEIFGTRGSTGKRKLLENYGENSSRHKVGQLDIFVVEAVDLQKVEKIHIGRMNVGSAGGWFVDSIVIVVLANNTVSSYKFNCSSWIRKGDPPKEFFLTDFEVVKENEF